MNIEHQNTGIATNVTRTRVTVLVFNLTIIALMLSLIATRSMTAGYNSIAHLHSVIALFTGFCLTILGIFCLLSSQDQDPHGLSRPWPYTFGAITTYLAMSQTITAFMHEYLLDVETAITAAHPIDTANSMGQLLPNALNDTALQILFAMGSAIWILTTYIAPIMVYLHSPVNKQRRWILVVYYFALQVPVYWVYAHAWDLQYASAGQPMNILQLFALQFFQPFLWFG